MSEIDCRPFEAADWPDMVRFYKEYYGPRYIFTNREFFDWNFYSPLRRDARCGQRLMVDGSKVIGIMGSLAWPMQVGGEKKAGEYNINLYLDPGYRGHRMGQRLLENSSSGYLYSMTNGFNEATLSMYERLGRVYHWKMRRFTKIVHADPVEDLVRRSEPFLQLDEPQRLKTLQAMRSSASTSAVFAGVVFEKVQRFGEAWDSAWQRLRRRYGFTTWRSSAFLNWRYADYPYPLYETYLMRREDTVEGLVALRVESPAFGKVVRIVDLVCGEGFEAQVFGFVEQVAKARSAVFIDYIFQGTTSDATLAECGYIEFHDAATGAEFLPMDFNPIRHRDSIPLLVTLMDRNDPAAAELERGRFYFVKGDSDQDRAN